MFVGCFHAEAPSAQIVTFTGGTLHFYSSGGWPIRLPVSLLMGIISSRISVQQKSGLGQE